MITVLNPRAARRALLRGSAPSSRVTPVLMTHPFQSWQALLNAPAAVASGTALANSTTLTDISPTPQLVLGANFLTPGAVLRLTAAGVFSNTATPTLLLGFYLGGVAGVAMATTGAVTTTTGATNWSWRLEGTFTVRSTGSAGTLFGQGVARIGSSLTAWSTVPIPNAAPANITRDTTAAQAVTVGAQWGTASASNTVQCHQFLVESVA
jgi:hypothetical protein